MLLRGDEILYEFELRIFFTNLIKFRSAPVQQLKSKSRQFHVSAKSNCPVKSFINKTFVKWIRKPCGQWLWQMTIIRDYKRHSDYQTSVNQDLWIPSVLISFIGATAFGIETWWLPRLPIEQTWRVVCGSIRNRRYDKSKGRYWAHRLGSLPSPSRCLLSFLFIGFFLARFSGTNLTK